MAGTLDMLRSQAAEMGEHVLLCRDAGHTWADWRAHRVKGGFEQTMKCSACGTERVRQLDDQGYIEGSWYRYPPGYLVEGLGRLSVDHRAALRLELVVRSVG